jgi:hypothetical protein
MAQPLFEDHPAGMTPVMTPALHTIKITTTGFAIIKENQHVLMDS